MRKKLLAIILLLMALAMPAHLAMAQDNPLSPSASSSAPAEDQPRLLPLPPHAEDIQQALWVLAIFVVLVIVLQRTAWKNVLAGLKARENRIRKDIADAEAARLKAESTLREYNQQLTDAEGKVRDILAKAAADAERLGQSIRMQAQKESEEIKERATQEIEASKKQAISEIYDTAANLATSVAEKILRRNLNVDDQRDLVTRSLDQMQELGKN
jgi:F-type H+-transporting ATPase subunit b